MTDAAFIRECFLNSIPQPPEKSVCEWGRKYVRLIGSARSEAFDPDITPWIKEWIETSEDGVTKRCTAVKPIQAAGSTFGEVVIQRRIARRIGGDIQYNWEDDEKAGDRWDTRIIKTFRSCGPVRDLLPTDRSQMKRGLIVFPHVNFTMQGAFTKSNLSSNSIAFQVNEELHGWKAGHLALAYGRTTAFWNPYIANISNAGWKGDQLHEAFLSGTQEHWEVKCPGCKLFHRMRTRWEDKEPHLGGLRYDSKDAKRGKHDYDYNKLAPTIRYQMPCGYLVYEDAHARRRLSLSGYYGEPMNPGAHISERSFTLEAVSVDYIPFLLLIQEKHRALKALHYGDPEPWATYLRERECRFYDRSDRPLLGIVTLQPDLKKDRKGMEGRALRLFALDRQQGATSKGELPHWWLLIVDVMQSGDHQIVFEGKITTDDNVIETLDRHEVQRHHGVADSGDDTTFVYAFCLKHGINCVKGDKVKYYAHEGGTKRIFSPERPLHLMLQTDPKYDYIPDGAGGHLPDPREPMFWLYSKHGILERLFYVRASKEIQSLIPSDVSDDFKSHMESWEIVPEEQSDGSIANVFRQVGSERDDLLFCYAYVVMQMDMAGIVGNIAVASPPAAREPKIYQLRNE